MKVVALDNPRQLGSVVRALVLGEGRTDQAREAAKALGMPHNVVESIKGAIGAATTGSSTFMGDLGAQGAVTRSFIDQLKTSSIFYALAGGNLLRKVPMRTPIIAATANASAWIVGAGKPIPLSQIAVARRTIEPTFAASLLVITDEMLREAGPDGDNFIVRLLRDAVVKVVDQRFLQIIRPTGATELTATGSTVDAMRYDLRRLLNAVVKQGTEAIVFAAAPDVVNALATYSDIWSGVTPNGGRLLGAPLISSAALSAGEMILVDGSGIVGNAGLIETDASDQTSIEMADTPSNDATTGTGSQMVSMFETGSVAVRVLAHFGADRIVGRDDAIATLKGITLGSHDSP